MTHETLSKNSNKSHLSTDQKILQKKYHNLLQIIRAEKIGAESVGKKLLVIQVNDQDFNDVLSSLMLHLIAQDLNLDTFGIKPQITYDDKIIEEFGDVKKVNEFDALNNFISLKISKKIFNENEFLKNDKVEILNILGYQIVENVSLRNLEAKIITEDDIDEIVENNKSSADNKDELFKLLANRIAENITISTIIFEPVINELSFNKDDYQILEIRTSESYFKPKEGVDVATINVLDGVTEQDPQKLFQMVIEAQKINVVEEEHKHKLNKKFKNSLKEIINELPQIMQQIEDYENLNRENPDTGNIIILEDNKVDVEKNDLFKCEDHKPDSLMGDEASL